MSNVFYVPCISLDGTSGIAFSLPPNLTQKVINKTVTEKDWPRLHLLFMGGGGERRFQKGSGGLGSGCDASSVPLDEIIRCDFPDLRTFINTLLDHKAIVNPQRSFKVEGQEALRTGENRKAIDLLELSLEHEKLSTVDEKRKTLQLVCELYFKEKSFNECLVTGQKLKATHWGVEKDVSYNWSSPWARIIKVHN